MRACVRACVCVMAEGGENGDGGGGGGGGCGGMDDDDGWWQVEGTGWNCAEPMNGVGGKVQ